MSIPTLTPTVRALVFSGFVAVGILSGRTLAQVPSDVPQEVLVRYSLAAESFKNQQYEDALPHLRWLLKNAPDLYNGRRIFERAYVTYVELARPQEDPEIKAAMLDSALQVLENAPSVLEGSAGFDTAVWYLQYGNYLRENEQLFTMVDVQEKSTELWRKAFDLAPESVDAYYARLIALAYSRMGLKDEAVSFMDAAEKVYAADQETIDYFDTLRNGLFKSPAERMAFLEGQLEKEPENLEIVTELFELYRNVDEVDKMEEIGHRLLEMDPSSRVYRLLAQVKYDQGAYAEALTLFEKSLSLAETNDEKRDVHYNMGLAYYELNRLPQARAEAEQALRLDASFGNAEMLIGDVYVRAVQGSNFERRDKAVYWLAVDHYRRAAQRDATLESRANQKINQYSRFFPDQEEKFFEGWQAGQAYEINYGRYSWISRSTTVK